MLNVPAKQLKNVDAPSSENTNCEFYALYYLTGGIEKSSPKHKV